MKLKVSELKQHLKEYDQKQLIQLITDLSKVNKEVHDYLAGRFLGEVANEELFFQAKKKIENEFFPKKGHAKLRLGEAKKAISTFEKITRDKKRTVDLMLLYVELGVEFTLSYGDINEGYYNSVGGMYEQVVSICNDNEEYYHTFAKRLKAIIDSMDDFGWGFYDYLCDSYYSLQWLDEEDEEE